MNETILLIDDNAIQAATRQAILKRAGYSVIAALNPANALKLLQNNEYPSPIALIITDHTMPAMSGADFVRSLRKTHSDLPVMVISGLEEARAEYDGMNVTFRMKPLQPELLLANVQRLIERKD